MHRTTRMKLSDLNHHLICVLCSGYFIDATTIIECLHSFCRTCIVRYLESSKYCPICDVQVHKTRPLQNIKADKTLQDLVYKLVPGLFKDEMKRRREFYDTHPDCRREMSLEDRGEAVLEKEIKSEEEHVSVCLELSPNGRPPDDRNVCYQNGNKAADRRYLLCPAPITVRHLKKFIRLKFSLSETYKITMYHTEEALSDNFTLLDVAYIYAWRRRGPLRLFYTIYEKPARKRKLPEVNSTSEIEKTAASATGENGSKLERICENLAASDIGGSRQNGEAFSKDESAELAVEEKLLCSAKSSGSEDRANNNTITENNSLSLLNGLGSAPFSLDIKAEPLDLSDPTSRAKCISCIPDVVGQTL